jgi:hypothetical protein
VTNFSNRDGFENYYSGFPEGDLLPGGLSGFIGRRAFRCLFAKLHKSWKGLY